LGIKGAVNTFEDTFEDGTFGWIDKPISHGMRMKFVRFTLTLRWLQSDLTEENVEMLRKEWPDIYFVRN
jgi:hypothetical protein